MKNKEKLKPSIDTKLNNNSIKFNALDLIGIAGPTFPNNPFTDPVDKITWTSQWSRATSHTCHRDTHPDMNYGFDGYENKNNGRDTHYVVLSL